MNDDLIRILALVDAIVLVVVGGFQVLLAIGKPYGERAWGGKHPGVLPLNLRVGSEFSVLLHAVMLTFVLARGDFVAGDSLDGAIEPALWIITGLLGLSTLANAASKSPKERRTWTPVAALAFLLTGSLALF
jgi:hypothetical protein